MKRPLDPAERQRLEEELLLSAAARRLAPRAATPCFGRLRLESAGGVRDVLLGNASATEGSIALIDWRAAPLAELFFDRAEGEEYELDLEGRTVSGRILRKCSYRFEAGELVAVELDDRRFERAGADWRTAPPAPAVCVPGRPPGARTRSSGPADVVLDPEQRALVELPPRHHLLLLGEAGFGKTTVALHRLAALRRSAGPGFRAAVVVPTEGLRRLAEQLLERLGVSDAQVFRYDAWAAAQARSAFPDLPRRESEDVPPGVSRLKRHPALRAELERAAARPAPREGDEDRAGRGRVRRGDLQLLFGDREVLQRLREAAGETLTEAQLRDTFEHTRVQFSRTAEEEWSHVESARLEAVDGRALDEGTPQAAAGTIDPEDYAVLFELDRLRAARARQKPRKLDRYDCLVLDEAQELAPLELALLGRALKPDGTAIVAGDAAQQVDEGAAFAGWDAAMKGLGLERFQRSVLQVSYRCPPEVTGLARTILEGPGSPDRAGAAPAGDGGDAVFRLPAPTAFHLALALSDVLRGFEHDDPGASIAVICRTAHGARALAHELRHGVRTRLALEGRFDFRPGVQVTAVPEVKGLEFDLVVVPDASAASYGTDPEARRALYVAVTRATHRLLLATPSAWTPLLPVPDASASGGRPVSGEGLAPAAEAD